MKPRTVLLLDTKRSNPNHYICLAIARALRQSDRVSKVIKSSYAAAIHDAQTEECDLFIAFDGEELDRAMVERLCQVCRCSVLWVTEDPYERSVNVHNADLFDLVFTNDAGSVDAYGAKGRHLPFAADRRFHFHDIPAHDDGHYFYDLFFAGTAWPNRSDFLAGLKAAIPDINLKLALPANPYIPEPKLGMCESEYDWRTPNTEFAKFSNRSRSVLTLHRAFSSSGNDPVAHTPGPRFFEVALAGGFQLVDTSIPDILVGDYFQEGEEFVGFDGVRDCVDKLNYYLAHPEERLQIARNAQQRAFTEHLYANRVAGLLASLDDIAAEGCTSKLAASRGRSRVLIVSHNILGVEPYGGVEVYQESIRQGLKGQFEIMFYVPDRSVQPVGMRYLMLDENMRLLESFDCSSRFDEALLSCPEREEMFSRLLRDYAIQVVHFQHLIGHVPSLGFIPSSLGIRSVLSLHDYYSVCARFNLLDYRGRYCNIPELPPATCDVCLNASQGSAAGSQARRRAFFGRMLLAIDVLHANTEGVATLYRRMYPLLDCDERIEIFGVPMPLDEGATEVGAKGVDHLKLGPLRIAIIGNFTQNKGGDQLVHALNQLRADDVEFTIFGRVAEPYDEIFDALKIPNVHVHGAYAPGTLSRIMVGYSMSMHFSLWPETYCISLSEAWNAGLVPIVSDIGALGERVDDGVNGFKLPVGEAGAIVALVRRLISDREMIEYARSNIHKKLGVEYAEHMHWLGKLYERLLPAQPFRSTTASTLVSRGNSIKDLDIRLVDQAWTSVSLAARITVDDKTQLSVTPEAGVPQRAYRFFRKHGIIKTLVRVVTLVSGKRMGEAK